MTAIPEALRKTLENHPGIHQAVLFGSVATGTAKPDSDLDIAIEAEQPLSVTERMRLIEDLAVATGRSIDLIDLKSVGEPLLGQILQQGQRILGSNSDYAALIRRHLFDVEDFMPYAQRSLRERRRAWIG